MSAFSYVLASFVLFCPLGGEGEWDSSGGQQSDPVVAFVQPAESMTIGQPLSYGSIQVGASDPDVGDRNGDGIARVEMVIVDVATGDVVASRSEYWPTYDFGPDLPDGDYELVATAHSSWWAGGTSSVASILVTIDTSSTTPPASVPPVATTTAPTTAPSTTAAPVATTTPPTTPPTTVASTTPTTTVPPVATTTAPTTAPSTTAAPVVTTTPPTTAAPTTPPTTAPASDVERANARSLELLNDLRAQQGLGLVAADQTMATFAQNWSAEMRRSGFRHSDGPYAENIVWHSDASLTPEQAAERFHEMWVNSPGHYANMTNGRWTLAGVGLYLDESGWWGTHVFR